MHGYLKSFAPWIAYAAGSALGDWRWGAAAGLAVGLIVLLDQRRTHGIELLTAVSTAFFAVVLPLAVVDPTTSVHQYIGALSLGALGAAAAASLLAGQPFTLAIAKRSTPAELWDHPLFWRVNTVITSVWATSFVVTALVCAVAAGRYPHVLALWVSAQVVGFLVPAWFTRSYPDRVRDRLFTSVPPVS